MPAAAASPHALRDIVGADGVRAATWADAVDDVLPQLCVAPGSIAEAAEVMRYASIEGLAVVPRGAGTKLAWGMPPERVDVVLSTARLDRVIEYAASDLVVRAEAGVRLSNLQAQVAPHGQRLALDPPEAGATLGGIVAAAASGPRRHRFGGPRDLLLGITVVLADATIAKAGGKVVKNVAGYDLGKLFAGSLGTLGVIVELAFRLHPLPATRGLILGVLETPEAAQQAVQAVLQSTLVPSAVELASNPGEPRRLGLLFEGQPPGVAAQIDAADAHIAPFAKVRRVLEASFEREWRAFAEPEHTPELVLHIAALPSDLAATLHELHDVARERGLAPRVSGHVGLGILQASFANGDADDYVAVVRTLRERLQRRAASVLIRSASVEVKRRADVFGAVGDALPLMRRVKERFDPARTLSPGRFVGGI